MQTVAHMKEMIEETLFGEAQTYVGGSRYERTPTRSDYLNGYYTRNLVTSLGYISQIRIPRTRHGRPNFSLIQHYQRRHKEFDQIVLSSFLKGHSTRKARDFFQGMYGRSVISAQTVTNIIKTLDSLVQGFHQRRIEDKYQVLILDALWVPVWGYKRKRPLLFAMGITPDGKKEVIDFVLPDK